MTQWCFVCLDHNKRLIAELVVHDAAGYGHAAQIFETHLLTLGYRDLDDGYKIIAEHVENEEVCV